MNLNLFGLTLSSERLRMIAALFFAAVTVYLMSQSPWNELSAYFALTQKIQGQQLQIQAARTIPLTRAQLDAKRQLIIDEIEGLRAKFPPRNQILSILLVDLSQIFHDSGVQLVSFTPSGFKPLDKGGVKDLGRIRIAIVARGEYPALISLFAKLARYDRVVRVESPAITPAGSSPAGQGAGDQGGGGDQGGSGTEPIAAIVPSGFNRTLNVNFMLTTFALNH